MIKVSVVIPVYNGEKYISSTLESLLNQDFDNYEIVIVNDGSTDNTLNEIKKIIEKRTNRGKIVRLINQENYGVSVARNKGLRNSNGKYIMFFDSDDLMDSSCLRKMHKKAKKENAEIVACGFDKLDSKYNIRIPYIKRFDYIDGVIEGYYLIDKMLKHLTWICTGSGLYQKNFLNKNNLYFTTGATNGEDQEFIFKALYYAKRVAFVQESLVKYVQRENSAVSSKSLKQFHRVGSMKRITKFLKQQDFSNEAVQLMEKCEVPDAYVRTINSLILSGFKFSYIRKFLLKNKFIKKELCEYNPRKNTFKEKIKSSLLVTAPSFYFYFIFAKSLLKQLFKKMNEI